MDYMTFLGFIAATYTTVAMFPQIYKIHRTQ